MGSGGARGRDLDLDVEADLKAHRQPWGCSMASPTTLHIGWSCHVIHTPWHCASRRLGEGGWPARHLPPAHSTYPTKSPSLTLGVMGGGRGGMFGGEGGGGRGECGG